MNINLIKMLSELFYFLENENKRRIRVVLDTGATFLMIPSNIAEELGCKPKLSKEFVNLTTATKVVSAPIVVIKKVDVLGKIVENVKAVVHDLPEASKVDGLLGSIRVLELGNLYYIKYVL